MYGFNVSPAAPHVAAGGTVISWCLWHANQNGYLYIYILISGFFKDNLHITYYCWKVIFFDQLWTVQFHNSCKPVLKGVQEHRWSKVQTAPFITIDNNVLNKVVILGSF